MLNIKVIPKVKPVLEQNVLSLTVIKKMNEKGKIVVSVVGDGKPEHGVKKKRWASCIWEGEATTSTALGITLIFNIGYPCVYSNEPHLK